jgi:excisionase family DNA binding protein
VSDRVVIAYTIAEAAKASGLSRSTIYELIAAKKIDARKSGARTLIPAESLRRFIEGLPAADIRTGQRGEPGQFGRTDELSARTHDLRRTVR